MGQFGLRNGWTKRYVPGKPTCLLRWRNRPFSVLTIESVVVPLCVAAAGSVLSLVAVVFEKLWYK